ncbi:Ig-like domain-containing protein (plasmid) [Paenibacillus rhizovicinus]|uniref:Ig-like domain-containing protein n=1 Tax=Paenibacillus rhizovicinus TaxID=2704463 RepID=A0A6C0PAW7_9BACL|nr:Ig-like domain-containing protein [Paenibacillus rhizovicinus]QHW35668.1 Ig-like domain-containing protein [Paenibacillus rhizovicinus]
MNFVMRSDPHHMAEGVAIDARIDVYFMVDLNVNTLAEGAVILYNLDEQKNLPIDFIYKGRVLAIQPKIPMSPLMHYQVQIIGGKDGVKDITGKAMPDTYSVEFYTADAKGIKPPVLLSPTDLSEVRKGPQFSWEAAADAYYYELEISKSNTFDVLVWPTERMRIFETSILPNVLYAKGGHYARIRTIRSDGARSAFSKPVQFMYSGEEQSQPEAPPVDILDPNEAHIETLQQFFADQPQAQGLLFSVEKTSPAASSVNLPVAGITQIVIEFSDDVDPESLTPDMFYVVDEKN